MEWEMWGIPENVVKIIEYFYNLIKFQSSQTPK